MNIEQKLLSGSPSNVLIDVHDLLKIGFLIKSITQSSDSRYTTLTVLLERVK